VLFGQAAPSGRAGPGRGLAGAGLDPPESGRRTDSDFAWSLVMLDLSALRPKFEQFREQVFAHLLGPYMLLCSNGIGCSLTFQPRT
jgi:hypothetical protein